MSFNKQTKQVKTSHSETQCAQSPLSVADASIKPFLTRRELAERLQIGVSTLSERYNKNSVRYDPNFPVPVRLSAHGRNVVFITVDVNAWCNAVTNRCQVGGVQ